MPHVIRSATGVEAQQMAARKPPFGPGLTTEQVAKTAAIVVMGSSFSDPGGDWCEFVTTAADGSVIARSRIPGY